MDREKIASDAVEPRLIRRVGAYRFLALVTLPTLLLLSAVCADVFVNLKGIQEITDELDRKHLPGILESQRTLANLETLRRNAETVYRAEDPRHRRAARLNAQALVAASVFETAPHFSNFADTARQMIVELARAKKRSDDAADALHDAELRFSAVSARLHQAFGLSNNVRHTHNARHVTSELPKSDEAAYQNALKMIEPVLLQCRDHVLNSSLRADCDTFMTNWRTIGQSWQQRSQADQEARHIWRRLDALLRKLSDVTSSTELKRAYTAMEYVNEQARWARTAFYISCLLLACIFLSFVVIMHRHILGPIALAARALHHIRFGLPPLLLPPVRIRELQVLLNLLPSLSDHLAALSARSGALEQEKNRYVSLSLIDALTGVGNRRSFDRELESRHSRKPLALLMLDVDMFKLYNDTQGHQAGDICLAAVARAMENALHRSGDKVFRYGGEEFAVLLPDVSREAAVTLAERLSRQIRALNLPHPASPVNPYVTVSIGVAYRAADEPLDDAELVTRADKALYRVKNSGRDGVCLYAEETAAGSGAS